jgi:hypothetical protein
MGKGSYDEIGSTRASARWFYSMVICSQVVGVIAVILVGVYFGQYRGGFGWGVSFSLSQSLLYRIKEPHEMNVAFSSQTLTRYLIIIHY